MSRVTLVLLGVLLCVTTWVYAPVLEAGFVYEDNVYTEAAAAPTNRVFPFAPRALTEWTFRANYLADGANPVGYHAVNLGLHLLTGALLFVSARRMSGSDAVALSVAGAFLLHPLNSQAVSYVAGRADLLAAVGVVSALTITAGGPLSPLRSLALIACLGLACGGKELGLMGGLVLIAYWRLLKPEWGPSKDAIKVGLTLALVVLGPLVYERLIAGNEYAFASERNGLGYMAVQSAAVWRYLSLVVWPSGLSIDHDFDLVSPALAFTALAALIVALVAVYRLRKIAPLVTFSALSVVLVLVPRFFVRIPEYLNEHQFYLSMIGVSLLVGQGFGAFVMWPSRTWALRFRYAQESDELCVLSTASDGFQREDRIPLGLLTIPQMRDVTWRAVSAYKGNEDALTWWQRRQVLRQIRFESRMDWKGSRAAAV